MGRPRVQGNDRSVLAGPPATALRFSRCRVLSGIPRSSCAVASPGRLSTRQPADVAACPSRRGGRHASLSTSGRYGFGAGAILDLDQSISITPVIGPEAVTLLGHALSVRRKLIHVKCGPAPANYRLGVMEVPVSTQSDRNVALLQRRAAHCRRLARGALPAAVAHQLEMMALRYEQEAAERRRVQPRTSAAMPLGCRR